MPKTKIPLIFRLIPKKQKPHKLCTCKALSIFGVTQLGFEPISISS